MQKISLTLVIDKFIDIHFSYDFDYPLQQINFYFPKIVLNPYNKFQ